MNATRTVNPAKTTTFSEAVNYLLSGGIPEEGSTYAGTFTVDPVHPDNILQYTRDLAEKVVPTSGRHRDHYTVTVDRSVIGQIVVTRDADLEIIPGVVAVPL